MPSKKKASQWTINNSPYIGSEIRRVIPRAFLSKDFSSVKSQNLEFATGRVTAYLPESSIHPRQPLLFHVEYDNNKFPCEDITLEELEKSIQWSQKRLSSCLTPNEQSREIKKYEYYVKQREESEIKQATEFLVNVLLDDLCVSAIDDLAQSALMKKREIEKKKITENMGGISTEVPIYYSVYPKLQTQVEKSVPTWYTLAQIYAKIQSSLADLYSAQSFTSRTVSTRRSTRAGNKHDYNPEDIKLHKDKTLQLLQDQTDKIHWLIKSKYTPAFMEVVKGIRKVCQDQKLVCKQNDFWKKKTEEDYKSYQFKKAPIKKENRVPFSKQEESQAKKEERQNYEFQVWRHKGVTSGYTIWSKCLPLPQSLQNTLITEELIPDANDVTHSTQTSSRRSKKSIFYGGALYKGTISITQIVESIFRLLSKDTDAGMTYTTLETILCSSEDESTATALRKKIPLAIEKLLYQFGKIRRFPVRINSTETVLFWKCEKHLLLDQYISELQKTELQLRKDVLQALAFNIQDLACAADAYFESDEEEISLEEEQPEWSQDHSYCGSILIRPDTEQILRKWKVHSYTPAIIKDEALVRRKLFKIVALDESNNATERSMLCVENQVCAGFEALEYSNFYPALKSNSKKKSKSWLLNERVSIEEEFGVQFAIIAGYHPITENPSDNEVQILLLYDEEVRGLTSEWVTLNVDNFIIKKDISISFHNPKLSQKPQLHFIHALKNHAKAGPFLEPVDPVELDLPDYNDIITHPMDFQTLEEKCLRSTYTSSDVSDEQFQSDLYLIFNNAMRYNPSSSWIHKDAKILKKYAEKELPSYSHDNLNQAKKTTKKKGEEKAHKKSKYYVPDSDTSDSCFEDHDYRKKRRRKPIERYDDDDYVQKKKKKTNIDVAGSNLNTSAEVIESFKVVPTYSNNSFLNKMHINNDAETFMLTEDWSCHYRKEDETDEDSEDVIEYFLAKPSSLLTEPISATSRKDVEHKFEELHEDTYAKLFFSLSGNNTTSLDTDEDNNEEVVEGIYPYSTFPPFLGRYNPLSSSWEIRSCFVIPAIRYILRGLALSDYISYDTLHSSPDEPTNKKPDSIISNHFYYYNPSITPFDVVTPVSSNTAAKKESDESEEEETDLTEYERQRLERVARNQERLKSLGLT